MKHFITFALAMLLAVGFVRPQSVPEVKSVAGCNFHDTRTNVRQKLQNKFGRALQVDDTEKVLSFSHQEIGGSLYDFVEFFFKYDSKRRVNEFVSAKFQRRFETYEKDKANEYYQYLIDTYKRKYSNLQSVSRDDVKYSGCGPLPEDAVNDTDFPIIIMLSEGLSKGGDKYIYVTVDYYYSNREDLYDDEI